MTIFALSSGSGRAGVAVIRISGKEAGNALRTIAGGIPAPRLASLRTLRDPRTSETLDRGLVLWFPAPSSFTGEDMAEFQLHGGRAVIEAVFAALSGLGLRLAEPGAFTRRAFENGKLDLTEVEGLADLINAETAAQRRQALAQASGTLRKRYESWRGALLRAMGFVEASLDFSGEADIAASAFDAAIPEVQALAADLGRALADGGRGEILREGIQVAIIGAPNVGKSSLLNALAGREAAIVFDEPGTTRDVIEVALDLGGYPFIFRDTAGLREAANAVEREGVRRALSSAAAANIVLVLHEAHVLRPRPFPFEEDSGQTQKVLAIRNKIDLLPPSSRSVPPDSTIAISAKTGEGLDALKAALIAFARQNWGEDEAALITRARHRQEMERAHRALVHFLETAPSADAELAAEDLREAADALGRLTGRLDVEDILGQIFSEFCIGK